MKKILKPLFLLALIIIAGAIGYNLFFSNPSPSTEESLTSLVTDSPVDTTADLGFSADPNEINREFVALLLSVQSISLDTDFFTDPGFSALVDYSLELNQPGNEGRPNPFAPIGYSGVGNAGALLNATGTAGPVTNSGGN